MTVSYNQATFVFEFPVDATGNVTIFYLDDDTNETSTIEKGKVLFENFFEAGNHSVSLAYDGDGNYYGIFDYYVDVFIKENADLDADAYIGEYNLVEIEATVNETATGNITFIIYDEDDDVVKNVTVEIEFGAADYSIVLPKGDYTYRVIYSGDDLLFTYF